MKNKLLKKLHSFWKYESNMDLILEFLENEIIFGLIDSEMLESSQTNTVFKIAYLPSKNYLTQHIMDLFMKETPSAACQYWRDEINHYKDEIVDRKKITRMELVDYYIQPVIQFICDSWDMKYELELNRESD